SAHERSRANKNCNPCNKVPWIPVARALGSVPAVYNDNGQQCFNGQYGPPSQEYGPPKPEYGPPKQAFGPPNSQYGPPKPEYGPQKQKIGPPPNTQYGPPKPEYGPPKQTIGPPPNPQYGPPKPEYGPPKQTIGPPPNPQYGPPKPEYGPPKQTIGPPPNTQYGPPKPEYGPPKQTISPPPNPQYGPPKPEYRPPKPEFGPQKQPPLGPHRPEFGPPKMAYGLPKHQYASQQPQAFGHANFRHGPELGPPRPPPPSFNFAPPQQFHAPKHQFQFQQTPFPLGYRQFLTPPPEKPGDVYQSLPLPPIPFPQFGQSQVPTFDNGQFTRDYLPPHLEPPKMPADVVITISEPNQECKKCPELPAAHPTQEFDDGKPAVASFGNVPLGDSNHEATNYNTAHNSPGSASIQVTKSIPISEYVSTIEYPMHIIHAPIVDVPDLPKYFNLGYEGFQHNPPNNDLQNSKDSDKADSIQQPSVSNPNDFPTNHKINKQSLVFDHGTTTTLRYPNEIVMSTLVGPGASSLDTSTEYSISPSVSTVQYSTSGISPGFTPAGVVGSSTEPYPQELGQFHPYNTTQLEKSVGHHFGQQSYDLGQWQDNGYVSNQPKPFATARPQNTKHIHQIIVPYTTAEKLARDPELASQLGWLKPVANQGRKVPPVHPNLPELQSVFGPAKDTQDHHPLSASGSEHLEHINLANFEGAQILNSLPPDLMNKLLQAGYVEDSDKESQNQGNVQHILAKNLRALLRGEEDSVDIVRLQKNIDKWTAEGFRDADLNAIKNILRFKSKKIPDEYLTTPATFLHSSVAVGEGHTTSADHDVAASQHHPVRTFQLPHEKEPQDDNDTHIIHEVNSWALVDTKMSSTTEETPKPWEKLQVSISPLTKEKVYVVTPLPAWTSALELSDAQHEEGEDAGKQRSADGGTRIAREIGSDGG
ncbi:hypothetical protein AAG570_005681, partial [Ranatra chinensis]